MGRHREETPYSQQTTVLKLQSKPDLFCRLSVVYYTALRASGRMCILEIASTRDDYSFATISECRFCLHKPLYMKTVMYIHNFIYLLFLSSLKMKVNIDEHHSDLNNH